MSNELERILANKRVEVERARERRPIAALESMTAYNVPPRNFYGAASVPQPSRPNLIAEIKRASPSAGVIVERFDPVEIARAYEQAGAGALSVLTDEKFFDGRLEFIEQVRAAVGLPVLRKDFLIEPYQLHESRAFGADAVLLIAEALDPAALVDMIALARELGLTVLLEVHSRPTLLDVLRRLQQPMRSGVLLGINNRDLKTQIVDLATTERLVDLAPPGMPIVAESGIKTRHDVERLFSVGARALLVGERLLRDGDPASAIYELFGKPDAFRRA